MNEEPTQTQENIPKTVSEDWVRWATLALLPSLTFTLLYGILLVLVSSFRLTDPNATAFGGAFAAILISLVLSLIISFVLGTVLVFKYFKHKKILAFGALILSILFSFWLINGPLDTLFLNLFGPIKNLLL